MDNSERPSRAVVNRTTSVSALRASIADAGTFPRIVSHDEARDAAIDLINSHFGNESRKGGGVLISIPAAADNTDILLMDYIKQQRAIASQGNHNDR